MPQVVVFFLLEEDLTRLDVFAVALGLEVVFDAVLALEVVFDAVLALGAVFVAAFAGFAAADFFTTFFPDEEDFSLPVFLAVEVACALLRFRPVTSWHNVAKPLQKAAAVLQNAFQQIALLTALRATQKAIQYAAEHIAASVAQHIH